MGSIGSILYNDFDGEKAYPCNECGKWAFSVWAYCLFQTFICHITNVVLSVFWNVIVSSGATIFFWKGDSKKRWVKWVLYSFGKTCLRALGPGRYILLYVYPYHCIKVKTRQNRMDNIHCTINKYIKIFQFNCLSINI